MYAWNPSNLNRVKEHEATAVSYTHAQSDSSNTMQLIEAFETLSEEECVGAAMVALNKSLKLLISQFHGWKLKLYNDYITRRRVGN